MFQLITWKARSIALLLAYASLVLLPGIAWSDTPERLKARVRELQTKGAEATVTTLDKAVIRGRIVRVAEDSFAIQDARNNQETVVPFARLKDVRKGGSSGHKKAILIPVAIVGGLVVVLCAAPYPIGFLCHKDPS